MQCPNPVENAVLSSLIVLATIVILLYLSYDGLQGAANIEKFGTLPFHTLSFRILISYMQITGMISLYELRLPSAVQRYISLQNLAAGTGEVLLSIECLAKMNPIDMFITKALVAYGAPVAVIFVAAIFFGISARFNHIGRKEAWDMFFSCTTIMLNLFFPTLVKQTASIFLCRDVDGKLFVDEAMTELCFGTKHQSVLFALAIPAIFIYVIGFPFGLFILLKRLTSRGVLHGTNSNAKKKWTMRLGFLFAGYEERYAYWETLVLARKAILSFCAIFLSPLGTTVQVTVALLILNISFWMQMKHSPLMHDWHDLMEERSLFFSSLALIILLLANSNGKSNVLSPTATIFVIISMVCISVFFYWTSIQMMMLELDMTAERKDNRWSVRTSRFCIKKLGCKSIKQGDDNEQFEDCHTEKPKTVQIPKSEMELIDLDNVSWNTMPPAMLQRNDRG